MKSRVHRRVKHNGVPKQKIESGEKNTHIATMHLQKRRSWFEHEQFVDNETETITTETWFQTVRKNSKDRRYRQRTPKFHPSMGDINS